MKKNLIKLINKHNLQKFPDHPQDNNLDDLILELAEFDAWVIGSALTALEGIYVEVDRQLEDIGDLCNRLQSSNVIEPSDVCVKFDSVIYCKSLMDIITLLQDERLDPNE